MKIIILSSRFPSINGKPDSFTVYHLIKHLSTNHEIILLSLKSKEVSAECVNEMKTLCNEVYTFKHTFLKGIFSILVRFFNLKPLQVNFFWNRNLNKKLIDLEKKFTPHIIYSHLIRTAEYGKKFKDKNVLAFQISHTLNYKRLIDNSRRFGVKLLYSLEYFFIKKYEHRILNKFKKNLFISSHDTKLLNINDRVQSTIFYSPHGIDTKFFSQEKVSKNVIQEPRTILFPADFSPATNREAADWLVKEIYPLLKNKNPDVKLLLIGRNPPNYFKDFQKKDRAIEVSGYVKDIRPYFKRATIVVDPVRSCAGLQNKILCALSMERAVIATNEANEGLNIPNKIITFPGDNSASSFAEKINFLLKEESLRLQIEKDGRVYVEKFWTWSHHFNILENMFFDSFKINQ